MPKKNATSSKASTKKPSSKSGTGTSASTPVGIKSKALDLVYEIVRKTSVDIVATLLAEKIIEALPHIQAILGHVSRMEAAAGSSVRDIDRQNSIASVLAVIARLASDNGALRDFALSEGLTLVEISDNLGALIADSVTCSRRVEYEAFRFNIERMAFKKHLSDTLPTTAVNKGL